MTTLNKEPIRESRFWFVLFFLGISFLARSQESLYEVQEGSLGFISDAPLELIQAASEQLQGILDLETGEFAFRVAIRSFVGFNSPLQQEHFFENYLEVAQYPHASFVGRIIEEIDFSDLGERIFRAKGIFSIHGVQNEQIVRVQLEGGPDEMTFTSKFTVLLGDHNIEVPRIVRQKVANEIEVTVGGRLIPKP